ncbi:high frequency lysogenization protein HflD [Sansalvadorimonas verongulae]|uniref:high frequency lysogenization protein HflD n=1 Tax=Sansalvadorimonas verongulae TaxID=2172824 RepID=UPI002E3735C5|nr:high frequency lysogenization protein HflD [Sansalvadorimonas verongulae]MTI13317.1 lysogenization regulator HflD [Sansalvadorimonas verongulae]
MTHNESDCVLALAGLFQACSLVEKVAKTGQAPADTMETAIKSIFNTNPKDVPDVYGDVQSVHTGLRLVRGLLERDPEVVRSDTIRYALTLIHLERKVRGNGGMMNTIGDGINRARGQLNHFDHLHENLMASLAGVYLDSVSTFKTRVQVTGNLNNLQNPASANKIRASLLAGLRSAILWRQIGGRRWHLVFSRKSMLREASNLLKGQI